MKTCRNNLAKELHLPTCLDIQTKNFNFKMWKTTTFI